MTWTLYNEVPNAMEIAGLCAGLAGAVVISVGKIVYDKIMGVKDVEEVNPGLSEVKEELNEELIS